MSASGLGSRAIIGRFYNRLEQAQAASWVPQVAMPFSSDQAGEDYRWLGMSPAMREWIGPRQAKGLRETGFIVPNKTFETGIYVGVDEMRRDKSGQINVRINDMADRAAMHDASLVSTLLLNGGAELCYDGQYFFDTDHVEGDNQTAQSNMVTFDISDAGTGGTATAPSARTAQAAILAAVARMMGFLDDQGEPMNEMAASFLVIAAPSLMGPVMSAIANPVLDSGATNTITNQRDFKISARINARLGAWTDKFAVLRTDADTKPFVTQEEEGVTTQVLGEGSQEEVMNNRHFYGCKRVCNAAYGYWQQAVLVTMQA